LVSVEEAGVDDPNDFIKCDKVGSLTIGVAVIAKGIFHEWIGDGERGFGLGEVLSEERSEDFRVDTESFFSERVDVMGHIGLVAVAGRELDGVNDVQKVELFKDYNITSSKRGRELSPGGIPR
jgi:hypothetical protein